MEQFLSWYLLKGEIEGKIKRVYDVTHLNKCYRESALTLAIVRSGEYKQFSCEEHHRCQVRGSNLFHTKASKQAAT